MHLFGKRKISTIRIFLLLAVPVLILVIIGVNSVAPNNFKSETLMHVNNSGYVEFIKSEKTAPSKKLNLNEENNLFTFRINNKSSESVLVKKLHLGGVNYASDTFQDFKILNKKGEIIHGPMSQLVSAIFDNFEIKPGDFEEISLKGTLWRHCNSITCLSDDIYFQINDRASTTFYIGGRPYRTIHTEYIEIVGKDTGMPMKIMGDFPLKGNAMDAREKSQKKPPTEQTQNSSQSPSTSTTTTNSQNTSISKTNTNTNTNITPTNSTQTQSLNPQSHQQNISSADHFQAKPRINQFKDIKNYHYEDSVKFIQEKGIVSGYTDGKFKPEGGLNRAELLKIALLAGKYSGDLDSKTKLEKYAQNCFQDVKMEDWFSPFVCFAKEKRIVRGYGDNTFKPDNKITFAETFKILSLAFGEEVNIKNSGVWYEAYVRQFDGNIPSEIKSFDQKATRGVVAEIIANRLDPSIRKKRICGSNVKCGAYNKKIENEKYEKIEKQPQRKKVVRKIKR